MKKATLEYYIRDSLDNGEFLRAVRADNLAAALHEIQQYLRDITKYPDPELSEDILEDRWSIRERIGNIIRIDNSIDLDELYQ